jgi:hypothetical protein
MSPRRRRLFRCITLCAAIALAWGVAEIAILLSGVNNDFRALPTTELLPRRGGPYELAPCGHVPYATIRMRYPTNPRGYFDADNGINHVLNSVGWRDREHPREKPEGTYRILGLGDSYLFGQGVKPDDRCLERLGTELAAKFSERQFETINTGQPGYNTVMEAKLLRNCGWQYDPDLVILHFVPNDVEPDIYTDKPKVEFFTEYSISSTGSDWFSRHSEVYALGRRAILGQIQGRRYIAESVGSFESDPEKWRQCRDGLADIAEQCRAHEVPLVVVAFPFLYRLGSDDPFQSIQDRLAETCRELQVPYLNLRDALRAFSGPELWVHPTDQHPNEIAQGIFAENVARFCSEQSDRLNLNSPATGG